MQTSKESKNKNVFVNADSAVLRCTDWCDKQKHLRKYSLNANEVTTVVQESFSLI